MDKLYENQLDIIKNKYPRQFIIDRFYTNSDYATWYKMYRDNLLVIARIINNHMRDVQKEYPNISISSIDFKGSNGFNGHNIKKIGFTRYMKFAISCI